MRATSETVEYLYATAGQARYVQQLAGELVCLSAPTAELIAGLMHRTVQKRFTVAQAQLFRDSMIRA